MRHDAEIRDEMSSTPSTEEKIRRGQEEISRDVSAGVVPRSVGSFAELHDYVDANEYAGLCEVPVEEISTEANCDEANRVQGALDAWIRGGGLR